MLRRPPLGASQWKATHMGQRSPLALRTQPSARPARAGLSRARRTMRSPPAPVVRQKSTAAAPPAAPLK
eukprot:8472969-Lingulodinium_polyedra.AAC.1